MKPRSKGASDALRAIRTELAVGGDNADSVCRAHFGSTRTDELNSVVEAIHAVDQDLPPAVLERMGLDQLPSENGTNRAADSASRIIAPVDVSTLTEPKPRPHIVEDLIFAYCVNLLFGAGGVMKSLLVQGLCLQIAVGGRLLGRQLEQGRCLFIDAELDVDEFARRAYRLARGFGWDKPPEGVSYWQLPGSLASDTVREQMRAAVDAVEPTLIPGGLPVRVGSSLRPGCGRSLSRYSI